MKLIAAAALSAFVLISSPAFAAAHAGGKPADKPDCTKEENKKLDACKKM